VVDAVHDAILEYFDCAMRREPVPHSIAKPLLYRAAWRNMANALKAERRRHAREWRYAAERSRASEEVHQPEIFSKRRAQLLALTSEAGERRAVLLWLQGADSEEIAEALGYFEYPPAERRAEVARFKDRLTKRARRVRTNEPMRFGRTAR
jgi:hypothetical protein